MRTPYASRTLTAQSIEKLLNKIIFQGERVELDTQDDLALRANEGNASVRSLQTLSEVDALVICILN